MNRLHLTIAMFFISVLYVLMVILRTLNWIIHLPHNYLSSDRTFFSFILYLPQSYYLSQRTALRVYISFWPEELRQNLRMFDYNGLLHNFNYINDERIRNRVACLPIEQQSGYVDEITYNDCQEVKRRNDLSYLASFKFDNVNFSAINTTALGNLAYLGLNHPNQYVRDQVKAKLEEIRDYYREILRWAA